MALQWIFKRSTVTLVLYEQGQYKKHMGCQCHWGEAVHLDKGLGKSDTSFFSGATGRPTSRDLSARSIETESCKHSSTASVTPLWHPLRSHGHAKPWA